MQAELVSGLNSIQDKFKPSLLGTKRKHVQLEDEEEVSSKKSQKKRKSKHSSHTLSQKSARSHS